MPKTLLRPNIIIIMSDQHNPHVMGCAGNNIILTPNLDALAKKGMQFSPAYCPSPLCVPSRMSFMTSQYPSQIKVWTNECALASDIPTMAHYLEAAGYETVLCGRMHFVGPDQFHGFGKRILADVKNDLLSADILGQDRQRTNGQTKYAVQKAGYGRTGFSYYDQLVTNTACGYLENKAGGKDAKPFCLVIGMILPHNPLICKKEYFDYYYSRIAVNNYFTEKTVREMHPAVRAWCERRGVFDISPEQAHRALAAYYGLVTELDDNIGKIMNTVDRSCDPENTVIIYCSDHGDMAYENGLWWKSYFFEGSAGVPLIISGPGRFPAGKKISSQVNLIDIGPTVLDMAQAGSMKNVAGKSFYRLLIEEENAQPWADEIFSEFPGLLGDLPSCMLKKKEWKLIYFHEFRAAESSYLLFNLNDDPEEKNDLSGDPRYRTIARDLLHDIKKRWSAEKILQELEKKKRDKITVFGPERYPHPLPEYIIPGDINEFNDNQLL